MTASSDEKNNGDDRIDAAVYRALGRLGWRLPRTEDEIRAAEEWVANTQIELPRSLLDVPVADHSHAPAVARDEDFARALRVEEERRALEERQSNDREREENRDR